ncbi:MAG: hypothetical protein IPK04_11855 [Bdellovibrionales bacterium]|nr:hypothetical protein [Bdellovibrionales bacterium]
MTDKVNINAIHIFLSFLFLCASACQNSSPNQEKSTTNNYDMSSSALQKQSHVPGLKIGDLEYPFSSASADEFKSHLATPTAKVDLATNTAGLNNIRPWIGHSQCPSCTLGAIHAQQFSFINLTPGEIYRFTIVPSYIVGRTNYFAKLSGGQIHSGQNKIFNQTGYLQHLEKWTLLFKADSPEVMLRLTNNLASGNNFLYFDHFIFDQVQLNIPESQLTLIGKKDFGSFADDDIPTSNSWGEFKSSERSPTFILKSSSLNSVRPWIGHSECSNCEPGIAKKQKFQFNNLTPGQIYTLTVVPAHVTGTAYYSALVPATEATLLEGEKKHFTNLKGDLHSIHHWIIRFRANDPQVTLDLGHGLTSGNHYLYFDYFVFNSGTPTFKSYRSLEYSQYVKNLDISSDSDRYKNTPYVGDETSGRYAWAEIYILDYYLAYFQLTGDFYWLENLVDHTYSLINHRDDKLGIRDYRGRLAPAWIERSNFRYAWFGFAAGLYGPMLNFAKLAKENSIVARKIFANSKTGSTIASEIIAEFERTLAHFEEDWRTDPSNTNFGYYVNPSDIPVRGGEPLKGKPLAYDFGAMIGTALIYYSSCLSHDNRNSLAQKYKDRVTLFANYFASSFVQKPGPRSTFSYWPFAPYYLGPDDVGHSNVNVLFLVKALQDGLGFDATTLGQVAQMPINLLANDNLIYFNKIDATFDFNFTPKNTSGFYYTLLSSYAPGAEAVYKAHFANDFSLRSLWTLGFVENGL